MGTRVRGRAATCTDIYGRGWTETHGSTSRMFPGTRADALGRFNNVRTEDCGKAQNVYEQLRIPEKLTDIDGRLRRGAGLRPASLRLQPLGCMRTEAS